MSKHTKYWIYVLSGGLVVWLINKLTGDSDPSTTMGIMMIIVGGAVVSVLSEKD